MSDQGNRMTFTYINNFIIKFIIKYKLDKKNKIFKHGMKKEFYKKQMNQHPNRSVPNYK